MPPPEFFGPLRRRAKYSTKSTTEYYTYEYYRAHFRDEIAVDCCERCVYCDSHENEVGGRESMELDHFRPWSRAEFTHLRDDPHNFHYACGRCNRLKGAHWPSTDKGAAHDGVIGFVDPFNDERRQYFGVNADGMLSCKKHPATYVTKLLQLNRPLLRMLRVRRMLRLEVAAYIEKMLPEIKAAASGGGRLTREQLATEWLKLHDYQRLLDLCDAPIQTLRKLVN